MREFLKRFPLQFSGNSQDNVCFDKYLAENVLSSTFGGYKKPFYNCIFNNGYQLEGWKIHISPYLKDYSKVLKIVSSVMLKNKTSFKFAYKLSDYLLLSDKNISPSQFGKYITIYPKDNTEFKALLTILDEKLKRFLGVRVPSDRRYKNSKIISYRFGGFFPQIHMNNDGDMVYRILDGNGNFVVDERKTYFNLPDGIHDPFPPTNKNHKKIVVPCLIGQKTKKKFEIISIIRRLGTGNIYEGVDAETKKHVIVKEARLGALPSRNDSVYRAWNLKRNEVKILKDKKIRHIINMPRYIDSLYIEDSYYIIEEKLNGISMREFIQQNGLLNKTQSVKERNELDKNLFNMWRQILDAITQLHKSGYIINDISDDNFIYNQESKRIALVDTETLQSKNCNVYSKIATNNFCIRMPEKLDDYNKDCYKLALLMFYTVFNKINDFAFDKAFFIKRFNLLKDKLTKNQKSIVYAAFNIYSLSKLNKLGASFNLTDTLDLTNLNTSKYNEEIVDISEKEIKNLKSKILAQYRDNFSDLLDYLKSTPYVGEVSEYSLVYGKLGTILVLKNELKDLDMTSIINKMKSKIVELNVKRQLNLGLFFGLAGTTLFEFYIDTPFERNYSLIKLLERLKNEPQNNSLCNGYAGIAFALQKISKKKGYPDFTEQINSILSKLKDDIGKTQDEGIEYGDLGSALVFLNQYTITKERSYLSNVETILKNYSDKYKDDNLFTGISYNLHKWKNIRSPYLMCGSAGLIFILFEYLSITDNVNWKLINKYIDSIDLPFTYNYGVNNGTAGILLIIKIMLSNSGKISDQIFKKLTYLKKFYVNQLFYGFISSTKHSGWPSDGQAFISDDLGSGTLGVLYVLTLMADGGNQSGNHFFF